jgi:hypothetical protein
MAGRYLILALVLLITVSFLVKVGNAETPAEQIARLQVSIDSLRAVQHDSGCVRAKEWTIAQVGQDTAGAALLADFGVAVLKDVADAACPNTDSMYVRVDYPLALSVGLKRSFVAGIVQETIANVSAIQTSTTGRLKVRKDHAVAVLRNLIALLKAQ